MFINAAEMMLFLTGADSVYDCSRYGCVHLGPGLGREQGYQEDSDRIISNWSHQS